jgi:hypothetical protein
MAENDTKYWISIEGEVSETPYTMSELLELESFTSDTLVQPLGDEAEEWEPAREIPELESLFESKEVQAESSDESIADSEDVHSNDENTFQQAGETHSESEPADLNKFENSLLDSLLLRNINKCKGKTWVPWIFGLICFIFILLQMSRLITESRYVTPQHVIWINVFTTAGFFVIWSYWTLVFVLHFHKYTFSVTAQVIVAQFLAAPVIGYLLTAITYQLPIILMDQWDIFQMMGGFE